MTEEKHGILVTNSEFVKHLFVPISEKKTFNTIEVIIKSLLLLTV